VTGFAALPLPLPGELWLASLMLNAGGACLAFDCHVTSNDLANQKYDTTATPSFQRWRWRAVMPQQ
jgi:hypothetical protein